MSNTFKNKPISVRLSEDDLNKLDYWADKYDMNRSELIVLAIHHYIGWKNGDYDLPTAERQRLNQLIDGITNLAITNEHLEKSIISGFDSMLGIIRGRNYLVESESGDL